MQVTPAHRPRTYCIILKEDIESMGVDIDYIWTFFVVRTVPLEH